MGESTSEAAVLLAPVRHREAAVRPLDRLTIEARVRASVHDAVVAGSRAREAVCRSSGLHMQGASGGLG